MRNDDKFSLKCIIILVILLKIVNDGRARYFSPLSQQFKLKAKILLFEKLKVQIHQTYVSIVGFRSDAIYEIPGTRTSRVTSLGYGKKDIGLRVDKYVPPIGTYDLGTQFKKDEHTGFNFGSGRAVFMLVFRKCS